MAGVPLTVDRRQERVGEYEVSIFCTTLEHRESAIGRQHCIAFDP